MNSANKLCNSGNLGCPGRNTGQSAEGTISSARLRLGDLLILAKLVTEQDVAKALERLSLCGGRLGENLVAIGAITKEQLEKFLHRTPREPDNIAATGL